MTIKIAIIAVLTSLFLMACHNSSKTVKSENRNALTGKNENETKISDISFTLAKNYFVNNTVEKLDNPKIETIEKFNEIFGMATTMGIDGKPTEIDFNKQYVIAVILPETDLSTDINPISLLRNTENEITLNYKSVVGQIQTYSIRPFFAVFVDKKETGNVTLKEIK